MGKTTRGLNEVEGDGAPKTAGVTLTISNPLAASLNISSTKIKGRTEGLARCGLFTVHTHSRGVAFDALASPFFRA